VESNAVELSDVSQLFDIAGERIAFPPIGAIYRGQGNSTHGLVPGLFRSEIKVTRHDQWNIFESYVLHEFMRHSEPYLKGHRKDGYGYELMLAQHFGVRTRLLDWSRNPLVALYFAVKDSRKRIDAALFVSHNGSSRASFEKLEQKEVDGIDCQRIYPDFVDERIRAQQSVFTIHANPSDAFAPIEQRDDDPAKSLNIRKFTIPANCKIKILAQLDKLGIDEASVFPGLDGIGRNVRYFQERDSRKGWPLRAVYEDDVGE
jgi:FRG domain